MNSTIEAPPVPLKGKLNHVKGLLDDANKRLQDEASKYEIFATKTSATATNGKQNGHHQHHEVPADLRRTITDISTIQSVLSCPIFGQIVNVTDSLDKLSYHLNLRPSIGPVDINIDSNGELILAPPMEPASLNNLINSRLDEFSNQSQSNSPQISSSNAPHEFAQKQNGNLNGNGVGASASATPSTTTATTTSNIMMEQHIAAPQQLRSTKQANIRQVGGDFHDQQQDENNPRNAPSYNAPPPALSTMNTRDDLVDQQPSSFTSSSSGISPNNQQQAHQQQQQPSRKEFNNEKLVSNGNDSTNHLNGNRRRGRCPTSKVQSVAAAFESQIAESSENRRLYKANGHFALNQMDTKANRSFDGVDRPTLASSNNELSHDEPLQSLGYTNDLYKTTHELTGSAKGVDVVDYKKLSLTDAPENAAYVNNVLSKQQQQQQPPSSQLVDPTLSSKRNNQRVSPTTSAGSTVPLGDECDSGTSSFRSQAAKGTLYSPQSHKPIPQLDEDVSEPVDSSLDQELIEKLSPDMERIKVTLEKDEKGLGITIAGYICEREEISGIFIKCITPGSPADRSGKIRILDQIFAVNGQEILGYTNAEATNVLRSHTSKVVTLELMRYLAESKYRKLQKLLSRAEPTTPKPQPQNPSDLTSNEQRHSSSAAAAACQMPSVATDLIKAQPGLGAASPRRTSQSTVDGGSGSGSGFVETRTALTPGSQQQPQPMESMYNNTSAFYSTMNTNEHQMEQQRTGGFGGGGGSEFSSMKSSRDGLMMSSQTPVAAQRGFATVSSTANKVIETKQGARNTIDIRSPMCQTSATMAATYANELPNMLAMQQQQQQQNNTTSYQAQAAGSSANRISNTAEAIDRQKREASAEEFGQLVKTEQLEWERDVQIVELYRDSSQSLGFTVKDYVNPKDQQQSIFMIVLITPGGIAERDGRLSVGDLLVFVDDTNLEGASPNEAVRALKRTSGQVRLGVLKYKRDY